MKRPLNIGLIFDLKEGYEWKEGDPFDANYEFDRELTVSLIESAINTLGFRSVRIGNVYGLVEKIQRVKEEIEFVFNIAEGMYGRGREAQVPAILEAYQIPFLGSDSVTLALTLSKELTKIVAGYYGIRTPYFVVADGRERKINLSGLTFPLIVKPLSEGSSKGIGFESVVHNETSLKERVSAIRELYNQGAVIEQFLPGREFTVPIIGNEPPQVLSVVGIEIDGMLELGELVYANEIVPTNRVKYLIDPEISPDLRAEIKELALNTYESVHCRDLGRVDLRLDSEGRPHLLEINPLPALSKDDCFYLTYEERGRGYEDMIEAILLAGLNRCGLI